MFVSLHTRYCHVEMCDRWKRTLWSEINSIHKFNEASSSESSVVCGQVFNISQEKWSILKWKIGLIRCLLHRAYCISSSWNVFSEEVDYLKQIFTRNSYPLELFHTCLKRFVNSKFTAFSNDTVKKDRVEALFFIPYIGLPSVIFGRKISESFKNFFGINVCIVFTSIKVKSYFSLKCSTPLPLLSNVVYKFQCLRDTNQFYIGKTKRHLATRVGKH